MTDSAAAFWWEEVFVVLPPELADSVEPFGARFLTADEVASLSAAEVLNRADRVAQISLEPAGLMAEQIVVHLDCIDALRASMLRHGEDMLRHQLEILDRRELVSLCEANRRLYEEVTAVPIRDAPILADLAKVSVRRDG